MNAIQKQRFIMIILIMAAIAAAAVLALFALSQNTDLFYSPSQVMAGEAPVQHEFRLGGLVQPGSIHHQLNGTKVTFLVTDNRHAIEVDYSGILPDLFRAGQAVVVEGILNKQNIVIADQVLAKHDERYMPAAVKRILN